MNNPKQLRLDATIRQVAEDFPASKPALEKHAYAKVDGEWSLQQISLIPAPILAEVTKLAKVEILPARPLRRNHAVSGSLLLMALGLLAVTGWCFLMFAFFLTRSAPSGEPIGYWGTIPYWWYMLQEVQLWGWVLVAGFGLAVEVLGTGLAGRRDSTLGTAGRGLMILGLVAMIVTAFIGGPGAPVERSWPALFGLGCLLFAGLAMTLDLLLLMRGRVMDVAFLFLLLAGQWMLVWLAAAFSTQWRLREYAMWDAEAVRMLTLLPALAFGGHLAMAIAARTLPSLLGRRVLRHRALLLGLAFFELGMVAVLPWPGGGNVAVAFVRIFFFGMGALVGITLFLAGLDFLRGPRAGSKSPAAGGMTIRVAFLWLAIGLLLAACEFIFKLMPQQSVPPAYVALYRHVLTAGFLGCLLFGITARMMPLFLPAKLRNPILGTAACALWIAGVLLHIVGQSAALSGDGGSSWILWELAFAAAVELAAAAMLSLLILRAVMASRRGGSELNAATRLDLVINASPKAEKILEAAGVGLLKDAESVPPVTVGVVALAWGWGIQEFLEIIER